LLNDCYKWMGDKVEQYLVKVKKSVLSAYYSFVKDWKKQEMVCRKQIIED